MQKLSMEFAKEFDNEKSSAKSIRFIDMSSTESSFPKR